MKFLTFRQLLLCQENYIVTTQYQLNLRLRIDIITKPNPPTQTVQASYLGDLQQ